jgi:hypothetical protein
VTRKPIQISAGNSLCALCDDGTIWQLGDNGWQKFPDIPQDEPVKQNGLGEADPIAVALAVYFAERKNG